MPILRHLPVCTSQPTGPVPFAAALPRARSARDGTRVTLAVSVAEMTPRVVELARSNGVRGGRIGNLPAGANRTFPAGEGWRSEPA